MKSPPHRNGGINEGVYQAKSWKERFGLCAVARQLWNVCAIILMPASSNSLWNGWKGYTNLKVELLKPW